MRFLKQITHVLIWIDAWLAMDIFLLGLFNPDFSTKGFVQGILIGAISYYFADCVMESIYWLGNCILDWLVKKGNPKE